MAYETYGQINGVIREIQRGDSCCSQILRLDTENGEVRFTVMADTMVIENVRLRRGMRVAAFYDTSLPVPAIYPPQYRAEIVTVLRGEQNVMLNFFDENLVAEDNSLRLNLSPVTNIMTQNGQRFTCSRIRVRKKQRKCSVVCWMQQRSTEKRNNRCPDVSSIQN